MTMWKLIQNRLPFEDNLFYSKNNNYTIELNFLIVLYFLCL